MDISFKAWHLPLLFAVVVAVACSAAVGPFGPAANTSQRTASGPGVGDQSVFGAVPNPTLGNVIGDVPELQTPTVPPPEVDVSHSIVPIEDVVFDTFRGGFIRLPEADSATIESLRDRIKPIYQPKYGPVEAGDWLKDTDLVVGFVGPDSGRAFAYPIKIFNLHEIVNDIIDGYPVLISYCPLCASGAVYDRQLAGEVLLFGNTSALYQSDLVMYDHQTGSYWFQVLGEAIIGPLSGQRLMLRPSVTSEWGQWKELYPETQVLSKDQGLLGGGFGNPYDRDSFRGYQEVLNSGRFAFPLDESRLDDRLLPGDQVFAVQVGQSHKAYKLTGIPDAAINDVVANREIIVVTREKGPAGFAFFANVDGRSISFNLVDGALMDDETRSVWNETGMAISGVLKGMQLEAVPSRTSFWFSLVGSLPDLELYMPN